MLFCFCIVLFCCSYFIFLALFPSFYLSFCFGIIPFVIIIRVYGAASGGERELRHTLIERIQRRCHRNVRSMNGLSPSLKPMKEQKSREVAYEGL